MAETAGGFGHPDPFIVTAHYLSASRPGPATVTSSVLRNGGSRAGNQSARIDAWRRMLDHVGAAR